MADFPDSTALPEISRPFVEAEIERLIDLLDTLDPDPDLESSGDDEPWLGAANPDFHVSSIASIVRMREASQSSLCSHSCSDDRELDDEREPDGEGTSNYAGPCSPVETIFPQPSQDLSR